MAEILDPSGPWTMELVELMFPVACRLEAEEAEVLCGAVAAAASSLFSPKGIKAFKEGTESVKQKAKNLQREARGGETESPAERMVKAFSKIGLGKSNKRGGRRG